jgi:lactoylglutathione lyase
LSENGGDPTQNGCFFEVNDVSAASAELIARGLVRGSTDFKIQKDGETEWKVFFVIAPDQLCYCFGEKV